MKAKLTLSVDEELIPQAKAYARSQGLSLSQIVETALREVSSESRPPFSRRWRGQFEPTRHDDERYRALADKYL
jgi:antitoxin component of RelBE/YafQ-DinJ toxin-antitoxin module